MAQKAAKATAKRNAEVLRRTHLLSLGINTLFLLLRALLFRRSFTRSSFLLYILLAGPALGVEFVLERNSRPVYLGQGEGAELRKSGEDVDAKGLTEWMWDVLYWTWGVTGAAAVLGDRAWWFWIAIPLYSAWLAYTTFGNVRQGLSGMSGSADSGAGPGGASKRQAKLEKRGGQRVQYR